MKKYLLAAVSTFCLLLSGILFLELMLRLTTPSRIWLAHLASRVPQQDTLALLALGLGCLLALLVGFFAARLLENLEE